MKRKIMKIIVVSSLFLGISFVFSQNNAALNAAENSELIEKNSDETAGIDNPLIANKLLPQPRADINDIWPGQTMMSDEFQLSDTNWKPLLLTNSANSLTTFPISVEGFEDGTLVGHIRFGGVDPGTGKFVTDKAKQLRNLVFIVENTKKFKGDKTENDPDRVTLKYTYNYYQGTNSTYTMVPITNMLRPGMEHTIENNKENAFEVPEGGSTVAYRVVKELYIQELGSSGVFAIQARTDRNQGLTNLDFYFQQIKTLIPTPEGGVRIVNEVKNTGWRAGQENKFPRKTFGAMIGEDTMLNEVDSVPIFSLGTNKGVYIANNKDLFRVAFPRLIASQGAADNYEGQKYNSITASTDGAFQRKPDGYGNEGQNLPLDTQVLPASGIKPPPKDPALGDGYDTQFVQKWNPRQPPELNEKALMSYDVNVLPIYKPEIKLEDESLNQSAHKDDTLTFKGNWRDIDSLHVTLYYQIESRKSEGWIEFKKDHRQDADDQKDKWFPFELALPANKFKLNGDKISFKAVDTTDVNSDEAQTTVNTFETVTIKTEHYGPNGAKIEENSFPATPGQGNTYTTSPNDYTAKGLTLDSSKTEGQTSGLVPTHDVLVKYYYKAGVVTVVTHYLKPDNSKLFPSKEVNYTYNETYTTDSRTADAKALDYYVDTITGVPTGPTGKSDQKIEVTYHYRLGKLGIVDVTNTLDFGSQNLISLGVKDIYPTTDTTIKLLDELSGNWELSLKIKDDLMSGTKPIAGELYFQTKKLGLVKLNKNGQTIHSREGVRAGEIDLTWERNKKEGLYFKQMVGNQKGEYRGSIEWNVVAAP